MSELERLKGVVADLSARNAVLEAAVLRSGAAHAPVSPVTCTQAHPGGNGLSRAGLLKAAAGGIAGAVGVVALGGAGATPALAAGSDTNYTAYGTDSSYSPDPTIGFDASDQLAGFNYGVQGFGTVVGVLGSTKSSRGYGVGAVNNSSSKSATSILGFVQNGNGILGESGTGVGVYGSARLGTGTIGQSEEGPGVHGMTKAKDHSGVLGENSGSGNGVHGTSQSGRGGVFGGGAAALQFTPSKSNTHPRAGQVGDIVLDAQHRLWFCKRGGNPAVWKQLA